MLISIILVLGCVLCWERAVVFSRSFAYCEALSFLDLREYGPGYARLKCSLLHHAPAFAIVVQYREHAESENMLFDAQQ